MISTTTYNIEAPTTWREDFEILQSVLKDTK